MTLLLNGNVRVHDYYAIARLCDPLTHNKIAYVLGKSGPNHPLPVIITHVRWNYEDNYVVVYDIRPDRCYDTFYVLGPPTDAEYEEILAIEEDHSNSCKCEVCRAWGA